jgi:hypothetical protein
MPKGEKVGEWLQGEEECMYTVNHVFMPAR